MHEPIEAPRENVDSAHCKGVTTEGKRQAEPLRFSFEGGFGPLQGVPPPARAGFFKK